MTPTIPPGAQVTGTEDQEFLNFVRQAADESVARRLQEQGVTPPAQAAPLPITVNLNGQNFTFNSQEDLNRALNNTFSAYNTELANARNAATSARGTEVTGGESDVPKFNMDTFVQKMQANPVDAFDYVDTIRYGGANPVDLVRQSAASQSQLEDISRVLAVYQFKDAHPEYEGNPQIANTMYGILDQMGLPFSAQGLEAAYSMGLLRGIIPLPTAFQQQAPANTFPNQQGFDNYGQPAWQPQGPPGWPQQQDPRQFNGGYQTPMAPPGIPRGAAEAAPNLADMAQDMTLEQIENVFAKFNANR